MTFLRVETEDPSLMQLYLEGYGTSEGVKKAWLKRKRAKPKLSVSESTSLFWKLKNTGGFTYHPVHHNSPKKGFVVALYNDYETPMDAWKVSAKTIREYVAKHSMVFAKDKDAHVGGWVDTKSKKVFLDISSVKANRSEAVQLGKKHKQLAIWDLGAMTEIRLKAANSSGLIRFDFPPDATPEEIAEGIRKLAE